MRKIKALQPVDVVLETKEQVELAIETILSAYNIPQGAWIDNRNLMLAPDDKLREATDDDRTAFACIDKIRYWEKYLQY